MAAAKVGGIVANDTYPADFIRDNLEIQTNVIDAAYRNGTREILFLGLELHLPAPRTAAADRSVAVDGPARADESVVRRRQDRRHQNVPGIRAPIWFPCHLRDADESLRSRRQLRPADFARLAGAAAQVPHGERERRTLSVTVWGSGTPRREFLYVDDLADALLFLMERYDSPEIINVGCGEDVTIAELARLDRRDRRLPRALVFDRSKPDGTPRKLLDVSKARALGWRRARRRSPTEFARLTTGILANAAHSAG